MRKLVVLIALSLTTSAAWAQAEKNQAVTKLPGEESLSSRERAERDFLMPVRRKKAAELSKPTASAEQLATAAPETDATAHYNEAPADPRAEEVTTTTHEAAGRSRAARHAAWLVARRAHLREVAAEERADEARAERRAEARRAARHSSHSSKSTKASRAKEAREAKHSSKSKHTSKSKHHSAEKASAHHSKKATTHKATHHEAAKKVKSKKKTKAASSTKHKHRR